MTVSRLQDRQGAGEGSGRVAAVDDRGLLAADHAAKMLDLQPERIRGFHLMARPLQWMLPARLVLARVTPQLQARKGQGTFRAKKIAVVLIGVEIVVSSLAR